MIKQTILGAFLALAVLGLARAQQGPASNTDELRFKGDPDVPKSSDTNVISDTITTARPDRESTTPVPTFPFHPLQDREQRPFQWSRPRPQPHPHPFNPFTFLLSPPGFGSFGQHDDDDDDDPTNLSPFRPASPLMDLFGGRGGMFRGGFPNPRDFRNHMDESIRDLESKPDIWSKEVQRYSINGVQYEKYIFTRKVDQQQQQQQQQQHDNSSNNKLTNDADNSDSDSDADGEHQHLARQFLSRVPSRAPQFENHRLSLHI